MAGKNERAATLPSSLRHSVPHTEENEGFFTKLRKKFKLKKGRYHVDVSTGECENIAAVSFKKRHSREVLDIESPDKTCNPKLEEHGSSKQSIKKQVEKNSLGSKGKERKLSNPETYTRNLNSSEMNTFQRSSFGGKTKSTNEYSPLTYDTKENVTDRSLKLRESTLKNDCVLHDDSAIDLDTDVEKVASKPENTNPNIGSFDPGYEKLPERRLDNSIQKTDYTKRSDFDPNYESVQEAQENKVKTESEIDPNYESVDDVKARMQQEIPKDEYFNIEDDPGYQSVKGVKMVTPERDTGGLRSPKTYSINQSIESLDEPGYESLHDVKKRITEQNFAKCGSNISVGDHMASKTGEFSLSVSEVDDFNDSAIGSVPKTDCLPQMDFPENRSVSGDTSIVTSEINSGLHAFAEAAVSLAGFATALTGSGTSKNSGFESKDRSVELEQGENQYNSVKKPVTDDGENPYSTVNKERKATDCDQQVEKIDSCLISPEGPVGGYDSDTELMLDPGYAECADAIKGFIPYSLYSEGSGSKMSSCTSLDLSAEDFALEPGYAECADAIKSGAIKKISVSHERLVDQTVGGKHEDLKVKGEISSEIYANPQILFRKRSKLVEDGNQDNLNENNEEMEVSQENTFSLGEEICLAVESNSKKQEKKSKKTKEVKEVPSEAPPLPARNYSLYLESEEAEQVVQEVLHDCGKDKNTDICIFDDAFETEEQTTNKPAEGKQNKEVKQSDIDVNCEVSCCEIEQKRNNKALNERCEKGREYVQTDTDKSSSRMSCDLFDNDVTDPSEGITCLQFTKHEQNEKTQITAEEKQNNKACKDELMLSFAGTKFSAAISTQANTTEQLKSADQDKCDSNYYDTNETLQENTFDTIDDTQPLENCLQVIVKDENGLEKILKVIEKQESFKIQKKRESIRMKASKCTDVHIFENEHYDDKDLHEHYDDKELQETKDKKDLKTFTPNSTNIQETKNYNDVAKQRQCCKEDLYMHSCCGMMSDTNCSGQAFKLKELELSEARGNKKDDIIESVHGPSETDSNNFLTVAVKMKSISVDSDSDFINIEDLPKLEINESDLESPFDSSDNSNNLDIEIESACINELTQKLNAEDIPCTCSTHYELELDIAQDESEKCCLGCYAGGISGEDEGVEIIASGNTDSVRKHLHTLEHKCSFTQSEEAKPQCSLVSSQKENLIASKESMDMTDTKETRFTDTYQSEAKVFEDVIINSEINDRKATLDSRLCVIDSEKESECDLSKLMGSYCDDTVAHVDKINNELSDDSAVGNIDDYPQNEGHNHIDLTVANTYSSASQDTTNFIANTQTNTENVSSQELHLIYEKEHPNLYEDTEPTHMSLQEAMGLSPQNLHVTRSHSDSSGHSLLFATSSNIFIHSNIPNENTKQESALTPPPRPPPVSNASQSKARISVPDQSGEAVTPVDEVPLQFSISYISGQSEEDSPPAIPPRHKTIRSPRRPVSYSQDFMESMRQLKDCGWYWGPLSWEEAEHKLAKKPEGTFLVRDSSDEHYILSLSFKNQGRVHHTRIEHHKGHFSFWSQPDSHGKSTIKEFIEQCVENSRNGRFLYFIRPSGPGSPPMPIQLLNPVSRFVQMRSLQHMCRFRILQLVRRDHIDHLPVPTRIKQYLKEAQYYVEYLDD
ncbi:uncharacterized protein LOC123538529 [Mercenaria mercenaria]|uniref:uncharacterized protein LOC123538529 n=1 Tax=Mercenaria mercenaria TaxID=6596 RepID=UPI00234F6E90|nr:uncharacterized protein LOC123538529 [Mercenaria mercenaria]